MWIYGFWVVEKEKNELIFQTLFCVVWILERAVSDSHWDNISFCILHWFISFDIHWCNLTKLRQKLFEILVILVAFFFFWELLNKPCIMLSIQWYLGDLWSKYCHNSILRLHLSLANRFWWLCLWKWCNSSFLLLFLLLVCWQNWHIHSCKYWFFFNY